MVVWRQVKRETAYFRLPSVDQNRRLLLSNRLRHSPNENFSVATFPCSFSCILRVRHVFSLRSGLFAQLHLSRQANYIYWNIDVVTLPHKIGNTPQRTIRTSAKTRRLPGVTYRSEYCFALYLHRWVSRHSQPPVDSWILCLALSIFFLTSSLPRVLDNEKKTTNLLSDAQRLWYVDKRQDQTEKQPNNKHLSYCVPSSGPSLAVPKVPRVIPRAEVWKPLAS